MPEYVILISAVACAGAGVALYYNHGNVPALAVVIVGAIALLYGVGQYVERDNSEARELGFIDAADRRAAQDAGINDSALWKRQNTPPAQPAQPARQAPPVPPANPAANTKKSEDTGAAQPPPPMEKTNSEPLPPRQPITPGEPSAKVTIANFTSRKTAPRYLEVSGTVVNKNEFAIKNILVTCGDKSFATGDVSVVVDKVVPARSDLSVAGLRLGPIRPELPPTTCVVAKYERAN